LPLHASEQLEPIWNGIREELRQEAPPFTFHTWIEPLELAGVQGHALYVRAPEHIRGWVAERYLPLLRRAAARRFDERATVEVVGPDWRPREERAETAPQLNPKYTFEQFVIGEGNRLAHAAALVVAELPAQAYNPVFLHGPPGLGKTHLLHAIGNYVRRYGGGLRVRYATLEDFTTGFVDAIRTQRTAAFKASFRTPDLVLIDDVQFLARGERTREEFFHTFNALIESGRQLVLTSDRPPEELPELEERLSQRFRSGLVVELERPGMDVRRAVLRKRARLDGLELDDAAIEEIASLVASSVRDLEGALIRVTAYASVRGKPVTPELSRHVLRRLGGAGRATRCEIAEIVAATAQEFGVEPAALVARSRRPAAARARQVAMFLARELTEHSLPEIGRSVGGRNHTTVLHAVNTVAARSRSDARLSETIDRLRTRLRQAAY
jgi:chromosomal replication initiator protein